MSRTSIIKLLIVGFLIRFALAFLLPFPSYPEKDDDAHQYDIMASNILKGNGFSQMETAPYAPTIRRTPVYPIFLALIFALFKHSYVAVFFIQSLFSVVTALLVYYIVRKTDLDNNGSVASLALILCIFCPFLWFSPRMLYTEALTSFLVVCLVYGLLIALEKGNSLLYFICGIISGIALLTRPSLALFPAFLFVLVYCVKEKKDRFVFLRKRYPVYLLGVILLWSVWIVRNYIVFKRVIPLSVASGSYLYLGTFPPNRYEKDFQVDLAKFINYTFKEGDEILALDSKYKEEGVERVKARPFRYILYGIQRIPILWLSSFSHYFNIDVSMKELKNHLVYNVRHGINYFKELVLVLVKLILTLINMLFVITGAIGMITLWRRWREFYLLLLIPAYFTLVHMFLGQANARYCLPAWPVLIIFSAVGVLFIRGKITACSIGLNNAAKR